MRITYMKMFQRLVYNRQQHIWLYLCDRCSNIPRA